MRSKEINALSNTGLCLPKNIMFLPSASDKTPHKKQVIKLYVFVCIVLFAINMFLLPFCFRFHSCTFSKCCSSNIVNVVENNNLIFTTNHQMCKFGVWLISPGGWSQQEGHGWHGENQFGETQIAPRCRWHPAFPTARRQVSLHTKLYQAMWSERGWLWLLTELSVPAMFHVEKSTGYSTDTCQENCSCQITLPDEIPTAACCLVATSRGAFVCRSATAIQQTFVRPLCHEHIGRSVGRSVTFCPERTLSTWVICGI